MPQPPIQPGAVAWSGHNPGIYLKAQQDGPWTGLATFFRVTCSPHGMGSGVLLLDEPDNPVSSPDVLNVCISDNESLARYLVAGFFSKFASFRVSRGMEGLRYLPMTAAVHAGDPRSRYQEIVRSPRLEVVMTWGGLGLPYAVDMPPEKGPTQAHRMYSCFQDASEAGVTVNGRPLRGRVAERDFAGTRKSTAFLAFSETWFDESPAAL